MSVHAYHEQLDGFDPRQIWHDGCEECEERGERLAIGMLDNGRFRRAWERAAEWNRYGGSELAISRAEAPLLNLLWSIQCHLERQGWPLGVVPTGNTVSL